MVMLWPAAGSAIRRSQAVSPGHRVQRDHGRIRGADEDIVPVQRHAAVHLVAVLGRILRQLQDVAPQEIAGRRIERQHLKAAVVQGHGDEHVPVVDDGRRLVVPAGAGGEGPHRLEGGDVGRRDAIERAVAPAVVGAAVHRPVVRLGIQQTLGGQRGVAGNGGEGCGVARSRKVGGDNQDEAGEGQPQGRNQAVPRPRHHRTPEHQRHRLRAAGPCSGLRKSSGWSWCPVSETVTWGIAHGGTHVTSRPTAACRPASFPGNQAVRADEGR